MRFLKYNNPGRAGGFTLIELIIVVIIISVLAGIVLPSFRGRTEQAKKAAVKAQLSVIGSALELFETDNGFYPSSEQGLDALIKKPEALTADDAWKGPYLKRNPVDPWGCRYFYIYPAQQSQETYDLYSAGPDRKPQTPDDIRLWDEGVKDSLSGTSSGK